MALYVLLTLQPYLNLTDLIIGEFGKATMDALFPVFMAIFDALEVALGPWSHDMLTAVWEVLFA